MSDVTLTHKDLAGKLGVSETTIKSYRRKFPGCFPVASKGKPIRFKQEAEEVALRIRDLFATGMSVEEVRERLLEDFSWWKLKDSGGAKREVSKVKADLPQNFATAVSNMAKSMISLNQQQTAILSAMQRIEEMLKEIGLSGFSADSEALSEARHAREADSKEMQKEMAAINVRLHSLTQSIAENNAAAAEDRAAFSAGMEKFAQLLHSGAAAPSAQPAEPKQGAQVLQFEQPAPAQPAAAKTATSATPAPAGPEFPRHILSLPLVVRTEDGGYLSAGGKSIGRISLNDLKAILAQTYLPPENFSMGWEHKADGWWVSFSQRGIPEPMESISIAILVSELSSSKGVSVLEARGYTYNGEAHPTSELVRFVTGVGKD